MIAAEGPLALPFQGLANLLAGSDRFQEVTGANDVTDALTRFITYPSLEVLDKEFSVPLAIITTEQDLDWQYTKPGSPQGLMPHGELLLLFMFPEDLTLENEQERFLKFTNDVGVILREMCLAAGQPDEDGEYQWNMIAARQVISPAIADHKQYHTTNAEAERVRIYVFGAVCRWA